MISYLSLISISNSILLSLFHDTNNNNNPNKNNMNLQMMGMRHSHKSTNSRRKASIVPFYFNSLFFPPLQVFFWLQKFTHEQNRMNKKCCKQIKYMILKFMWTSWQKLEVNETKLILLTEYKKLSKFFSPAARFKVRKIASTSFHQTVHQHLKFWCWHKGWHQTTSKWTRVPITPMRKIEFFASRKQ